MVQINVCQFTQHKNKSFDAQLLLNITRSRESRDVNIVIQELVKVDVAVTTSRRRAALSCVRRFAVVRPRFSGRRSVSTVLSHDCLGRPGLRLQSAGVSAMQACRLQSSVVVLAWICSVETAKEGQTTTPDGVNET